MDDEKKPPTPSDALQNRRVKRQGKEMGAFYKGHRITTTVRKLRAAKVTHVVYLVEREDGGDWTPAREGVLYGPFYSTEEASAAADLTARLWIDQQQPGLPR